MSVPPTSKGRLGQKLVTSDRGGGGDNRAESQRRISAPGRQTSLSANRGNHPRQPWGPVLTGQDWNERILPYPWAKNGRRAESETALPVVWKEHRAWCEKMWEDGPRNLRLRAAANAIKSIQQRWQAGGEGHRVPQWVEGREPRTIAEIYYMHHLPSAKGYVGMAYHGAHDRMRGHWGGRNREKDPSSVMMSTSASPYEWICWPIESLGGQSQAQARNWWEC